MTVPDLLVIGDCNPDLVLDGDLVASFGQVETLIDDAELVLGGSASIVACGAARLGLRTTLASLVGDDAFGRSQLEGLAGRGVETSRVVVEPGLRTGVSVIFRRADDRAILTALGATAALTAKHLEGAVRAGARHVHVTPYFLLSSLRGELRGLLELAREHGATTSLDTNWDPGEDWSGDLDDALAAVECFMPNAEEAMRITGCRSPIEAAAALAEQVGTVVVKMGAEGAYARSGAREVTVPAVPADLVDTVGAGDSFAAGFLAARLRGRQLEDSLRIAVACGSLSTRASGGTAAQATMAEALEAAGLDPG